MTTEGNATSPEQVIKELQQLGFSDYEAKSYIALLQVPSATAYEISKAAGIPKANCYTVLETLRKKEAVQPISENPVKYVAVDPKQFFNKMAINTRNRCDSVQQSLQQLSPVHQQEFVWSLNDSESVHTQVEKIIQSAKRHLWIKASEASLERHRDALQAAADKGVTIRIVLFGKNVKKFEFSKKSKAILHEGNGLWVGIGPTLITITRDFEEALVADVGTRSYGSYTKNRPIVNLADSLLRHEIYLAEIIRVCGPEIEKKFGPALINLRQSYLPGEQIQALKELLKSIG